MNADRRDPVKLHRQRRRRSPRQRVGWVLVVIGVALFVTANVGARMGVTVLPFDPHHLIGQLGGPAFGLLGASLIGRG